MATLIATIALVILFAGLQHLSNLMIRSMYKDPFGHRDMSTTLIIVVLNAVFSVILVNLIILLNR